MLFHFIRVLLSYSLDYFLLFIAGTAEERVIMVHIDLGVDKKKQVMYER